MCKQDFYDLSHKAPSHKVVEYEDELILAAKFRADALQFFLDDQMEKHERMADIAFRHEQNAERLRVEVIGGCVK